jgi:hypothetical protein
LLIIFHELLLFLVDVGGDFLIDLVDGCLDVYFSLADLLFIDLEWLFLFGFVGFVSILER